MVKGRRAADRRRERQGKGADDGEGLTTPGASVDPLPDDDDSGSADDDLPLVSQVREIEISAERPAPSSGMGGTIPARKPTGRQPENDPEASFVKAMRESSEPQRGTVGDVTAVRSAPQRSARVGARLVVLEGPDEGGEADIDLIPSLIGRAAAAEIGLTDPTISLRHLELRHASTGDGYAIVDLGSTSGTLVNGILTDGEVSLRHGDVIALGKTTLRFLRGDKQPAARPAPREASMGREPTERMSVEPAERSAAASGERSVAGGISPSTRTGLRVGTGVGPRPGGVAAPAKPTAPAVDPAIVRARIRRTTTRVIGACVAILVVAVVGKLVHARFFSNESPAQIRGQVAELLADGRNRLRAQDVDGASASAQTVLALDDDNEEAHSLLRMAATESEARDAVALALRLGDEERDVEAGQILKRIPDASVFAPTRDRLRRTLEERGELRSRRAIEAMLDQGRLADALAAAEKHVVTYPDDDEGKPLLERVRDAQKNAPRSPGLGEARAAFAAGDTARAKALARASGLEGYARDVERFEAALAKGRGALSRFDSDAADSLNEAFLLLGQLGATASSPIFAEVRKPYGRALFISGVAKIEGDGAPAGSKAERCEGARELYRAGRVLGDDAGVQQKLRDLEELALAGLEKARAARLQDGARSTAIAREHVCLARPGTRTYEELRGLSRL